MTEQVVVLSQEQWDVLYFGVYAVIGLLFAVLFVAGFIAGRMR